MLISGDPEKITCIEERGVSIGWAMEKNWMYDPGTDGF